MSLADDWFTSVLINSYEKALALLQVRPTAEPQRSHLGRSTLSGPVLNARGQRCWLRIGASMADWKEHARGFWTGAELADEIKGVAKPALLGVRDWIEKKDNAECVVKATLMTEAPSPVCSEELALLRQVNLGDEWLKTMRSSLDALAAWPTERQSIPPGTIRPAILMVCGTRIDSTVARWTTAHADMHWCNVTAPVCCILDWESWGLAPAGFDAATLYCSSLLVPSVAERIFETFRDVLETHDGVVSQLLAAQHLLSRIEYGEHAELADPLHDLIARLVQQGK